MSAYGHQMEREYSAESLSSRGNSESESQYIMESGFYMTSFAATIFIAALATFGVLVVTLVISLTVMLQSCKSRSAGVLKSNYEYDSCKNLALHAELNNGEMFQFPRNCRALGIKYIEEGQYSRDLNSTMRVLEDYLKRVDPRDEGRAMFLLDIDDILTPNSNNTNLFLQRNDRRRCSHCIRAVRDLKQIITLRIFTKLREKGWPVILMSRKPETCRNVIMELLLSSGYRDWSSLMLRYEDEVHIDSCEYLSRRRAALENEGLRLVGIISSRFDAFCSGGLVFKLPNPIYFNFESKTEYSYTLE